MQIMKIIRVQYSTTGVSPEPSLSERLFYRVIPVEDWLTGAKIQDNL